MRNRQMIAIQLAFGIFVALLSACVRVGETTDPVITAPAQVRTLRATPATPSAARVIRIRPVPSDIDASGTQDVTTALQRLIDSTPDGSQIVFPSRGTYRLSRGLQLKGRHDLVFVGNSSTLRSSGCDHTDSPFYITDGTSRVRITGFSLVGDNPSGGTSDSYRAGCEYQAGVNIHGAADITVNHVDIRDVWGDCLFVDADPDDQGWARRIRFTDSSCQDNGRMAIAICAGRDVTVARVAFDRIALHVFDIEPWRRSGGARRVSFTDNRISSYGRSPYLGQFVFLFVADGERGSKVSDVLVNDNRVTEGSLKSRVTDDLRRDIYFLGNRGSQTLRGPALVFRNVNGVTIHDNDQPLSSGRLADLRGSRDVLYYP